jgi:copper chaperone CopZ
MTPLHLTIEGMTCAHCVRAIEDRLRKTPGIELERVAIGSADLHYDASAMTVDDISHLIADEGYTAFAG